MDFLGQIALAHTLGHRRRLEHRFGHGPAGNPGSTQHHAYGDRERDHVDRDNLAEGGAARSLAFNDQARQEDTGGADRYQGQHFHQDDEVQQLRIDAGVYGQLAGLTSPSVRDGSHTQRRSVIATTA